MISFFVSWALWQQMTFVLACAIVVVFFMGLGKLYWTNRLVKRQVVLDEEKHARVAEIRKIGHTPKRNDIPFGVRAIQTGVEVDGIWISRPNTPASDAGSKSRAGSYTTLVSDGLEAVSEMSSSVVRWKSRADEKAPAATRVSALRYELLNTDSTPSSTPSTAAHASHLGRPFSFRRDNEPADGMDEEVFAELQGDTPERQPGRPAPTTTTSGTETHKSTAPTRETASHDARPPSSRSSASGETDYLSVASSLHSRHSVGPTRRYTHGHIHHTHADANSKADGGSSPYARDDDVAAQPRGHSHGAPALPLPTFGPGNEHANRKVRRSNAGFEVLPAGTFGAAQEPVAERRSLSRHRG